MTWIKLFACVYVASAAVCFVLSLLAKASERYAEETEKEQLAALDEMAAACSLVPIANTLLGLVCLGVMARGCMSRILGNNLRKAGKP